MTSPHAKASIEEQDRDGHKAVSDHDYVAANIAHFDALGEKFESMPFAQELADRASKALLAAYPFDEEKTTVMDFACGIGMISQRIASHCKSIVGVDISESMVNIYNQRVENQGIPPEEMHAIKVTLTGAEGELNGQKFDAIVCSMAYHHIPSIQEITRVLAYFLKPGGTLLIVDLLQDPSNDFSLWNQEHGGHGHGHGHSHGQPSAKDPKTSNTDGMVSETHDHLQSGTALKNFEHIVAHSGGFVEDEIRVAIEGAGLEAFSLTSIAKGKAHGFPAQLFLAKATKPGAM